MNYKKLIGFGALIWGVAFMIMTAFIAYQLGNKSIAAIGVLAAVIITSYLCGRNLQLTSKKEMLRYSVSWAIIGFLLDMFLTVPFAGWIIFQSWEFWLGYTLVLMVPLITVKTQN